MDLKEYYDQRAEEYEKVYGSADKELEEMSSAMQKALVGKNVLEVACGTGYWTARLAPFAHHVVAIDSSPKMLKIAESKRLPAEKVAFKLGDAYTLDNQKYFDGGLAIFWFSHIPKARVREFFDEFHSALESGSTVFIGENRYIEGIDYPLISKLDSDDTFEQRKLEDGSPYEVLKNYYDEKQLQTLFDPFVRDLQITMKKGLWWLTYKTK